MIKKLLKTLRLYKPLLKIKKGLEGIMRNAEERKNSKKRIKFYSGILKPNDLAFDVGANVGNRVVSFKALGCRIVAIEPQEDCYNILKKRFGNSIEVVKMGLGEREEEKTLYVANESTISSLSEEWIESVKKDRFKSYNWDKRVTINLTTLDRLIEKYGLPDFCKIDVEGYEYEVLKGLTVPIPCMSLEYTVPEQISRLEKCVRYCLNLYPEYKFNYSAGESMDYALREAVGGDVFLRLIYSGEFQATGFGDIYVIK